MGFNSGFKGLMTYQKQWNK